MMRRLEARLVIALALGATFSMALGCERNASGLTEWTPADHDHQSEQKQRHNLQTQAQKSNPRAAPGQKNQVIDVTWMKQCATCHGRRGKGDGPSSTMVKARDLTDPAFQATLSDEQMAKVIREGKDKMPAFNLPASVIDGLVTHVRGMVRKKRTGPDDDGVEPGSDDGVQDAPAPTPNAPASTGNVPAPAPASPPAAPKPGSSDKPPAAPTEPARAGTPASGSPPASPPGASHP